MGVTAARKAARAVANTRRILAVEALAAAQAIDFRRPLATSSALEAVHRRLRKDVPRYDRDRVLAPEIERAAVLVMQATLADEAAAVCGTLE
jgi:histidine ammonia-lyase